MLRNFNNFLNEGLEYTDFFGKNVSHEDSTLQLSTVDALQKRIRDYITQIIVDEIGISEKSFSRYDQVIENVKDVCESTPEIYENLNIYYNNGKRLQYCAEKIYDKYFKYYLNESSKFDEQREDVNGKVLRSKKLNSEMKEKITPLIINGQTSYKKGKVFRLKYNESKNGCSLGADKNGFFRKHWIKKFNNKMINKYKTPKIDIQNVISFTCSDDAIKPVLELLEQLRILGSIGSSRDIIVEWGGKNNKKIFFDGDGRDRVNNITINGLKIKEWEDEWLRLESYSTIPTTVNESLCNNCETNKENLK